MSDVGTFSRLAPSPAQLPVHAYFSESLLAHERPLFFERGPGYVGHRLMVPEAGDFYTLAHEDHGRVLIHGRNGISLLSNICRHRQAVMLEGRGNTESIVCPLHRWTYNLNGQLVGAPHFDEDPCRHLRHQSLTEWNGLLFEGKKSLLHELNKTPFLEQLSFDGFVFHNAQVHHCAYNWKSFIEVYMDDYHVVPFHPGLGKFVDCNRLRWHFGDNFNIQAVGITDLGKADTSVYQRWQQEVLRMHDGQLPKYGAIWMTIYPNIMVEWYPKVLVVSTLHPIGPQETVNVVEFYYPEEIAYFEPSYIEAQQAAYNETVREDDEIALRMDRGRKALLRAGRNEVGPYHSPMEDGMLHFHEYLRRQLGDTAFESL
jgi:phenylpropionate dioxygenase-like ring-hydroxylating dioxygenase large terminal subunit